VCVAEILSPKTNKGWFIKGMLLHIGFGFGFVPETTSLKTGDHKPVIKGKVNIVIVQI